jgi:regulator of sirC expression with transglutaminase-like and TPR domain
VARGTQHRKRRTAQDARKPAVAAAAASPKPHKQKPPQWQEELFFQRLRNHAKWAYVALAIAFVLGFVLLGVGSGSTGLSDVFQNAFNFGSSGGTSISSLQKKTDKHPKDATAWRDLATAYEQKQRTQEAVNALQRYTALRPKDDSGLAELASQYTTLSQKYAGDYQSAQTEAATAAPSTTFAPPPTSPLGKAYADPNSLQDPIAKLIQDRAAAKSQTAYSNYQGAQRNAEAVFKKLAKLTPADVTVQYQLGQAAQAAGDYKTAVAAYQRFLKLSPNDVDAPTVKQLLKQVQAQATATAAAPRAAG